jgi:hypothetical protein
VRILIDHWIDWRLGRSFAGHDVKSARDMGWEALRNGALLAAAAPDFDCVLTVDQNLKHQQDLSKLPVAVIVLVARSNRLTDLIPLVPSIEKVLVDAEDACGSTVSVAEGVY